MNLTLGMRKSRNTSINFCSFSFCFVLSSYFHKTACKYRGLDVSRNYNADTLSPDQMIGGNGGCVVGGPQQSIQQSQPVGGTQRLTSATPTMQQRIKALGVATPLALSSPVRRWVFAIASITSPKSYTKKKKKWKTVINSNCAQKERTHFERPHLSQSFRFSWFIFLLFHFVRISVPNLNRRKMDDSHSMWF